MFGTFALGLIGQLGSLLNGVITGGWSLLKGVVGDAFDALTQYNQRAMAFSRQMGMSAKQAQAYSEVLVTRAKDLGKLYGISADKVFELQENLANASGKALMLNNEQAERMIQINKLVGANVANQFTSEMMTHMGGQLSAVQGAVSRAYATAAKSGLNAAQFSEKVAKNLSLANKLSFRDGVNGIIRMTALSEKLGFNLQSVEQAANNFMELDKAIEHSAQLQMLGGAAGAYGSNPLLMSYEANYDPEAFTERMTKTLGGYATFDTKTGMANVNGMNRDFVKNIAQAMGISMDEAMSIAKKQAEVSYKEAHFGNEIRNGRYSKQQEDYIINSSYIGSDGRLKMTDLNGQEQDVDTLVQNGQLDKMMSLEGKSEDEIMRDQALTLTSIKEAIEGFQTSFTATVAEPMVKNVDLIYGLVNNVGNWLIDDIGPKLAQFLDGGIKWIIDNKEILKNFLQFGKDLISGTLSALVDVAKFFYNNWGWLKWALGTIVAAIAFNSVMSMGTRMVRNGRRFTRMFRRGSAARATRGAPAATMNSTIRVSNPIPPRTRFRDVRAGYQLYRNEGYGRVKSAYKGLRLATNSPNVGRFSRIGGKFGGAVAIAGGGLELYSALSNYGAQKNQLDNMLRSGQINQDEYRTSLAQAKTERNENVGGAVGGTAGGLGGAAVGAKIGAGIGTFFGPGLGTAIGAGLGSIIGGIAGSALGQEIGKGLGKVWNGITSFFGSKENEEKTIFEQRQDLLKKQSEAHARLVEDNYSKYGQVFGDLMKKTDESIVKTSAAAIESINKKLTEDRVFYEKMANDSKERLDNGSSNWVDKYFDKMKYNIATYNIDKIDTELGAKHKFSEGGIISGNQTEGDNVLVRVNSGEMILNLDQQSKLLNLIKGLPNSLFNEQHPNDAMANTSSSSINKIGEGITNLFGNISASSRTSTLPQDSNNGRLNNTWNGVTSLLVRDPSHAIKSIEDSANLVDSIASSILTNTNDVIAKPVGEREYIYEPRGTEVSNVNGNQITVNDINVKINGIIKLDAGNSSRELELSKLLNDSQFISSLKEIIKTSMNNDVNGGRFMNDTAQMRGLPSQTALWGRR